jgi:hypothetical protein
VGGIVNGAIDAVQEIVGGILHIVKDVGSIVGSILRLDLPGLIDAFLHLLVDIGIFILDVVRTVTPGFFIGHIVENFERNSLREFVDGLLQAAFDEPRRTQVRDALRMDDPLWGLRCRVTHSSCVMESPAMPLAAMHNNNTLDLFSMAGVLSFDSFRLFEPRYTVKWLDAEQIDVNGNVTSSQDFRGMTAGREIREGDFAAGCQTPGRDDQCYSLVQHIDAERRQIGSGVAMRNVYPGYFSKIVMAHELGHYFGLCHINHSGVQNIMFSTVAGNLRLGAVQLLSAG